MPKSLMVSIFFIFSTFLVGYLIFGWVSLAIASQKNIQAKARSETWHCSG